MFGVEDIPGQAGRVVVVTGANGGLGFQTASVLTAKGARVFLAARDADKTARAIDAITRATPDAQLTVVPLDLGSLASVGTAAAAILAQVTRVDVLVNNAGVMGTPEGRTADGFETQLGVDHLGHWALTAHLMPALLAAPAARVVTVILPTASAPVGVTATATPIRSAHGSSPTRSSPWRPTANRHTTAWITSCSTRPDSLPRTHRWPR